MAIPLFCLRPALDFRLPPISQIPFDPPASFPALPPHSLINILVSIPSLSRVLLSPARLYITIPITTNALRSTPSLTPSSHHHPPRCHPITRTGSYEQPSRKHAGRRQ